MKQLMLLLLYLAMMINLPAMSQTNPKREMRAIWIATVGNIDWPSAKNLTVEQQQMEFIALLEQTRLYHMNTIIFQIRPAADAFYPSKIGRASCRERV